MLVAVQVLSVAVVAVTEHFRRVCTARYPESWSLSLLSEFEGSRWNYCWTAAAGWYSLASPDAAATSAAVDFSSP